MMVKAPKMMSFLLFVGQMFIVLFFSHFAVQLINRKGKLSEAINKFPSELKIKQTKFTFGLRATKQCFSECYASNLKGKKVVQ